MSIVSRLWTPTPKREWAKVGDRVVSRGGMQGVVTKVIPSSHVPAVRVMWRSGHSGRISITNVRKIVSRIGPKDVQKALNEEYGPGVIEFYRAREGYYYFMTGSIQDQIPSLYWHNLEGVTVQDVLDHVKENYRAR